ncbi:hypothetical protein LCGC14_1333430 [marine sediment metagenome]|uniref:VanZ-like domain-containing protein n=1 Tax=marine sediment metagenome TaxID=412755 RepID=A0A0F9KGJ6_9ZZZZ
MCAIFILLFHRLEIMTKTKQKWINYTKAIPAIFCTILIFYFSSLSNPYLIIPPQQPSINLNSILHMLEFGLLSFLVFFGFFSKAKSIYLLSFPFLYAIVDEIHQYFVPSRYFDVFDILLDSIGVVGGIFSYFLLRILYDKIKNKFDQIKTSNNSFQNV